MFTIRVAARSTTPRGRRGDRLSGSWGAGVLGCWGAGVPGCRGHGGDAGTVRWTRHYVSRETIWKTAGRRPSLLSNLGYLTKLGELLLQECFCPGFGCGRSPSDAAKPNSLHQPHPQRR
ncbi:hypothetical protein NIBR502772_02125 [Pseudarthrobacter sp. NIBRBAC000502772]|nr:hypothetical protein NIBR502772_02125 [Pseudarthrobacter sp. NIBRBAC000502772]